MTVYSTDPLTQRDGGMTSILWKAHIPKLLPLATEHQNDPVQKFHTSCTEDLNPLICLYVEYKHWVECHLKIFASVSWIFQNGSHLLPSLQQISSSSRGQSILRKISRVNNINIGISSLFAPNVSQGHRYSQKMHISKSSSRSTEQTEMEILFVCLFEGNGDDFDIPWGKTKEYHKEGLDLESQR